MYTRTNNRLVAACAATLFIAACANAENESVPRFEAEESVPEVVADLSNPAAPPSAGRGISRLVEMAKTNLAANLGIDASEIAVGEAGYVTWRNSSVGCPAPGTAYTEVLTHGSRIVLKANNGIFHYHSGGNLPPTYCPEPSVQKPLPYAAGES